MKPNGNQIVIEVKSDNGQHVMGFTIFPPNLNDLWEVYENDGTGNGSHYVSLATFDRAMAAVSAQVQRVVMDGAR